MEHPKRSVSARPGASTSADGKRRPRGRRLGSGTAGGRAHLHAAGFSAVETLAAIGLLSVVILSMAVGADRGTRYDMYSRTAATATTLVHDQIEQLQTRVSTAPELTGGAHADANNPITSAGAAGGTYTRTWTVTNNTPIAGLKTVAVTVTWSLYGSNHTITEVMVK